MESRISLKSKKSRESDFLFFLPPSAIFLSWVAMKAMLFPRRFLRVFVRSLLGLGLSVLSELQKLDVEAERLQFLDEHLERLGHSGLRGRVALDDRLVHLGAALNVVGLDGQKLLEHVG